MAGKATQRKLCTYGLLLIRLKLRDTTNNIETKEKKRKSNRKSKWFTCAQ